MILTINVCAGCANVVPYRAGEPKPTCHGPSLAEQHEPLAMRPVRMFSEDVVYPLWLEHAALRGRVATDSPGRLGSLRFPAPEDWVAKSRRPEPSA